MNNDIAQWEDDRRAGKTLAHTFHTAPFELLYHTSPGRGLVAPTEAMLIIDPPLFCSRSLGMMADVPKKTPLTLTSKHLSKSVSVTSRVGCNEH